jgi:hypothetical protein
MVLDHYAVRKLVYINIPFFRHIVTFDDNSFFLELCKRQLDITWRFVAMALNQPSVLKQTENQYRESAHYLQYSELYTEVDKDRGKI